MFPYSYREVSRVIFKNICFSAIYAKTFIFFMNISKQKILNGVSKAIASTFQTENMEKKIYQFTIQLKRICLEPKFSIIFAYGNTMCFVNFISLYRNVNSKRLFLLCYMLDVFFFRFQNFPSEFSVCFSLFL